MYLRVYKDTMLWEHDMCLQVLPLSYLYMFVWMCYKICFRMYRAHQMTDVYSYLYVRAETEVKDLAKGNMLRKTFHQYITYKLSVPREFVIIFFK